jgi:5-methylcytosine-specific restriction endonuclease McrA
MGHPLADKRGRLLIHRLTLFNVIGPGVHPCHWCGTPVEWGTTLQTDHVNWDRRDNSPENLVPSCGPCNSRRVNPDNKRRKAARA